ncbi:MAG TPA: PilZ domain-containing protein [Allosphingosinicella sp.]|nr:PilZ domain-containing protein [Allosphingosinicella sp.]
MFEALIRRKNGAKRCTVDEYADESTLFSLTTEVPRPSERRTEERLQTILPVAKLVTEALEALCRIKNISVGGLMAEVTAPVSVGTELYIEMNPDQRIPGRVVWARDGAIGVKFDQDVDLRELLANRRPREGFRPRPPRLEVTCGATVRIGKLYHQVEVRDISQGGIKVALNDWQCAGKDVIVTIESLRPVKGRVRWYKGGHAGIVFDKPLGFEELAEWMGKRLEVASLRTGAWDKTRR